MWYTGKVNSLPWFDPLDAALTIGSIFGPLTTFAGGLNARTAFSFVNAGPLLRFTCRQDPVRRAHHGFLIASLWILELHLRVLWTPAMTLSPVAFHRLIRHHPLPGAATL